MSLSEQNRAIPTPDNFRLFGFATGSYMCHCHTCKVEFEGDKRAITCLPCALTRAETAVRQDGSAGDAGASMRHTLSVQATDKSDRAEGVAALRQAEVERMRLALEEIAKPPFGIGFNGLRSIAKRGLGRGPGPQPTKRRAWRPPPAKS